MPHAAGTDEHSQETLSTSPCPQLDPEKDQLRGLPAWSRTGRGAWGLGAGGVGSASITLSWTLS